MATTKMRWVKLPKELEKYLDKEREGESLKTGSMGLDDYMASTIQNELERNQDSHPNKALEIIQSWSHKESTLFDISKYNSMGQELAEKVAPGHLSWVVTHTEKNHVHNHIVISAVHSETGKRLKNKKSFLYEIRNANDEIAKQNGLEILGPPDYKNRAKVSERAKEASAHGKFSWKLDLAHKIETARSLTTSFDELVATLQPLGVDARIENKNITYFYADRKKGIRGKSLGKGFGKDGLMEAFKENDLKYANNPNLRTTLLSEMKDKLSNTQKAFLNGKTSDNVQNKDYSLYTKRSREKAENAHKELINLSGSFISEEIEKAKNHSIFEYCKKNNIKTYTDKEGITRLQGRDSIILSDREWKNTKNNQKGSIIQFVMNHDRVEYLDAIAKLNNNPHLLLLKHIQGPHRENYHSFYVPRNIQNHPNGKDHIKELLRSRGTYSPSDLEHMSSFNGLYSQKEGSVWFLNSDKNAGIEYTRENGNKWTARKSVHNQNSLFEQVGSGHKLYYFPDPFSFALANRNGSLSNNKNNNFFVGFDEISKEALFKFLANHSHIKNIEVVNSQSSELATEFHKNVHEIKKVLDPFKIEIQMTHDPSISRERGPSIEI